ncbi:MAG TPA: PspC domain-containing protein [Puia sp.]|nr:PspC domain-containing protein [Puia sp.]
MKKIININFHSRVIPIEETAYEILQQYVDSLRRYFATEEGRDEIISDIENRFSELFYDKLKKGAPCITDEDVNAIITSMGRPEELAGEPEPVHANSAGSAGSAGSAAGSGSTGSTGTGTGGGSAQQPGYAFTADEPRRLYRAANDKILGGVCAGLASYLKLDPAIIRILFVLITIFGGFGFLLYIVLWIVLPTKSVATTARKRLYRNPDDRVIAGVASGLAAYFHVEVWIPRLIFALPLFLGIFSSIFRNIWWHTFNWGGHIFFDGFGGSLFVAYIVLWIVLPEAITASEKLEMRGEKIDLESIKNTVKSDLESFKGKAKEMGVEMGESFKNMGQKMGTQIRQNMQSFGSEAGSVVRRSGTGIGHAIGVLFKAFFLCIAGIIAFALIMSLIAIAFSGGGLLDLKSYVLDGFWENILSWASFILVLVVPVIALLTWLIRRITGMRSQRHYLGYVFATLWIIGLISFVVLAGMVMNNFRSRAHSEEEFALVQPSTGNLVIKARQNVHRDYYDDEDWWFGDGWRRGWRRNGFFYTLNDDSILLNTVQIKVLRSDDSAYHMRILRGSLGSSPNSALDRARQISFPVTQTDSVLQLPGGFSINKEQKFRNQQVIVAVYIPVGKKIMVDNSVSRYDWFNINAGRSHFNWEDGRNDYSSEYDDEGFSLENNFFWNSGVQYIMTTEGLQRVNGMGKYDERSERPEKPEHPEKKEKKEAPEKPADKPAQPATGGYRYKPTPPKHSADTPLPKSSTMVAPLRPSPFVLLSSMFI